jgi:hypothetical protein
MHMTASFRDSDFGGGTQYLLTFCERADSEIRTSITSGRCTMLKHDFVSDGFLALTAAGLVLLCSSLLAVAFG